MVFIPYYSTPYEDEAAISCIGIKTILFHIRTSYQAKLHNKKKEINI